MHRTGQHSNCTAPLCMPYSIRLTHRSYPNTVSSGDGEGGDKDKDKDGQKDKEKDREKEPKRHTDPFERNGGKSIPLQLKALNECLLGKWPRPCTPLVTLLSLHSSPCPPILALLSLPFSPSTPLLEDASEINILDNN